MDIVNFLLFYHPGLTLVGLICIAIVSLVLFKSFKSIGPTQIGLVNKRLSFSTLKADNPIAFEGEAGYQEQLLMPGLRFKLWPVFIIEKHPWVQVPAGEIGVVIGQVGEPLPISAYRGEVRRIQERVCEFLAREGVHRQGWTERCAAAGAASRIVAADSSSRVSCDHEETGLRYTSSPRAEGYRGQKGRSAHSGDLWTKA